MVELTNLPASHKEFFAENEEYGLPRIADKIGDDRWRKMKMNLKPGETTHMTVTLEPLKKYPVRHYEP